MDSHVKDGKKHLNLDEYTNRNLRHQYHKMEEVAEQVKENEMPLESYNWMHKRRQTYGRRKNQINKLGRRNKG